MFQPAHNATHTYPHPHGTTFTVITSSASRHVASVARIGNNQTKPNQNNVIWLILIHVSNEHVSATGKLATVNSRAYVYVPAAAPFVQRFWRCFSWFSVARHRAVSLFLYLYVEAFIHAIRAAFLENLGNAKCGMRNVECVCALCVRVSPLLFRIHLHLYV